MTDRHRWSLVAALVGVLLVGISPLEASARHDEFVNRPVGTTERVSLSSGGTEGDGDSGLTCAHAGYSASDDGRFVAFASEAGNLHPADVNGSALVDIFVYDRKSGKLDLVSALPTGLAPTVPPTASVNLSGCALGSHSPAISGRGRYVAFVSNLPLTEGNELDAAVPVDKVYVRDLKHNRTELVSRTFDGRPAVGNSGSSETVRVATGISISDSGRFVAFTSEAPNMVEGACPGPEVAGIPSPIPVLCGQSYVRDRKAGQTILVSKSSNGDPANFSSLHPSVSGDGRFVAFDSEAGNLIEGDLNQCRGYPDFQTPTAPTCRDVFLHELKTGETHLVSVSRNGGSANASSALPLGGHTGQPISDDGQEVGLRSFATDLVPANLNLLHTSNSFVRDVKRARTERVSVSSVGTIIPSMGALTMSDDGRYAFTDLIAYPFPSDPLDEDIFSGFFLHDRSTGQVDRVTHLSYSADEQQPDTRILGAILGGDARFIVGHSNLGDLVQGDKNEATDVFLRDLFARGLETGWVAAGSDRSQGAHPALGSDASLVLRDRGDDAVVGGLGVELLETQVVKRPEHGDLLVRVHVDRLPGSYPLVGVLPVPVVYSIELTVGERAVEIRAQGWGGDPSQGGGRFGLFGCIGQRSCDPVVDLQGGYGTTGETVVVSVPLRYLEIRGGMIEGLSVRAGLGTFERGLSRTLDSSNGQ